MRVARSGRGLAGAAPAGMQGGHRGQREAPGRDADGGGAERLQPVASCWGRKEGCVWEDTQRDAGGQRGTRCEVLRGGTAGRVGCWSRHRDRTGGGS